MKSIETQKLGYVAYPVIVDEIQQLAESVIDKYSELLSVYDKDMGNAVKGIVTIKKVN